MVLVGLRALLVGLSFLGYFLFLEKKKVDIGMAPVVTFSTIGVVMFFAGLLNAMAAATYGIVICGLALLIAAKPWTLRRDGRTGRIAAVLGVFLLMCVLVMIRLYREIPTHYDGFSHWLTVVREMLRTDSMPNFRSVMIMFQGYPTGSAGFIYFVCKAVGASRDDLVVFAQAVLILSALLSLTAFIQKEKVVSGIVFVLFCLYGLTANIQITELLVDTLVSLLSVAAIAIAVRYRDEPKKAFFLTLPIQVYLIAVKNSGILMVGIDCMLILIVLLYAAKTDGRLTARRGWTSLGYVFLDGAIPMGVYYLWLQHVKYVFDKGTTSKHTASAEYYESVLKERTPEDMREILTTFGRRFFSWNGTWLFLIAAAVVLAIGMICRRKAEPKRERMKEPLILAAMLVSYGLFMAVLAAMYLVSMPYAEAVNLSSYQRYENTIVMLLSGILAMYLLCLLQKPCAGAVRRAAIRIVSIAAAVGLLCPLLPQVEELMVKPNAYTKTKRYQLEQIRDAYGLPEGASYLIVDAEAANDAGYTYFLGRYVFWSPRVGSCTPEELPDATKNRQYLIVLTEDEQVDRYLREHGHTPGERAYTIG